jgi:hypothetical protein
MHRFRSELYVYALPRRIDLMVRVEEMAFPFEAGRVAVDKTDYLET